MWQRIQTLWWIISILAIALFGLSDFLLYRMSGAALPKFAQSSLGVYDLVSKESIYQSWSVAVISGISIALSLVCIFIYRMRPFQIRLSVLNALVQLGLLATLAYLAYDFTQQSGTEFAGVTAWLSLPFVGIITQILAARAVLQDELLIRMSNRIR